MVRQGPRLRISMEPAWVWGACALMLVLVGLSLVEEASAQRSISMRSYYRGGGGGKTPARTIRGFKQAALSTARGFGKRDSPNASPLNRDDANADLTSSQLTNRDSLPLEWVMEGLQSNPMLARLFLQRLLEVTREADISSNEALSPISPLSLTPIFMTDKSKEDLPQRQEQDDVIM